MTYRTYLPLAALVAAIAVLAWVLFDIGQRFIPALSSSGERLPAEVKQDARPSPGEYRVDQIIAAHLFGVTAKPQPVVQQAPETRLRLTLLGVLASNKDQQGRAVIASDAARDQSYSIGENIKGTDAKLYAIEKDRVIIERGKRLEKLSLDRPDLASAVSQQGGALSEPEEAPPVRSAPRAAAPNTRQSAPRTARRAPRARQLQPRSDGSRQPQPPRIPF